MEDPKNPRRMWRKPKRPLNYELKMEELKTLGTFGLRSKRELWKAHTELSRVRHQARSLLALRQEIRLEKEPILMKSLSRIGLVSNESTLDDVLNLQVNDLLSRRLQTLVSRKFGFKTPYQARQAVIHGHIMIGDRKVMCSIIGYYGNEMAAPIIVKGLKRMEIEDTIVWGLQPNQIELKKGV